MNFPKLFTIFAPEKNDSVMKYPIGTQTFKTLIEENMVYVDKTDLVYNLAQKRICFLPYAGDTDGMFEVKADKQYVLFSENHAEKGERCDEYVMTCDGNHENNMIYIIFSPNMFVKASDTQSGEKVKVGNEILSLPRQLPYRGF